MRTANFAKRRQRRQHHFTSFRVLLPLCAFVGTLHWTYEHNSRANIATVPRPQINRACCQRSFNWAKSHVERVLNRFQNDSFSVQDINDAFRSLRGDKEVENKFFLVTTTSTGEIEFSEDEVDDFTANCKDQLLKRLERMQQKENLPDVTFIFSSLAALSQIGNASTKVPIFSACSSETDHQHIFIPRAAPHWSSRNLADRAVVDFARKEPKVFFRGSLSSIERARLFNEFSAKHDYVDISMTGVPDGAPCDERRTRWCPGLPAKWVEKYKLKKGEYVTMKSAANTHRYVLSVDGVGCADRLPALLSSNMIVFKSQSELKEFWYRDLVPNKHYIPIKPDFSDLISKVKVVRGWKVGDQKRMIASANEYVRENLSEASLDCYMFTLLRAYALKLI